MRNKTIYLAALTVLIPLGLSTRALAQSTTAQAKPATPPAYTSVRWSEDYSYLKNPSNKSDYFDSLKYIPLGADDFYLSLGGQVRERYEYFNNDKFGSGAQDEDGYFLHRILLHADLHVSKYFRVFVQGRSSLEDGREAGPRSTDLDEAELQQAFFDINVPWTDTLASTFRLGRQEILLGKERVIGPGDWGNIRKNFEGLRITTDYKTPNYTNTLDLFAVRPTVVKTEQYNEGDDTQSLWGIYNSLALPHLIEKANSKVEVYGFAVNQTKGEARNFDADLYTTGARFCTNPKPWDLDVEGAYQFGDRNQLDVSSFFVASEVGFTLAKAPATPRFYLGFDYATGDDSPTDSNYNTFTPSFQGAGHGTIGIIDAFERPNIMSPTLGVDLLLLENKSWAKKVNLRTQYLAFWRASNDAGLFNAYGSSVSRPASSDESFIGQEVDVMLTWQYDRHLQFSAGYSHLFAGDYISDSANGNNNVAQDIDFAYFAVQFTF